MEGRGWTEAAVYIGVVDKPYWRESRGLFECANRIRVRWDRDANGEPIVYVKEALGINNYGGFWLRAFAVITDADKIEAIEKARKENRK
jgi:hypothetical protein